MAFVFFLPGHLYAAGACSSNMGKASFNEFFKNDSTQAYGVSDFVEIKILDGTISSTSLTPNKNFNSWKIKLCEKFDTGSKNDTDGCSANIPLSSFTDKTNPWLVIDGNAAGGTIGIGKYINFKTGFDAILLDSNDDIIDYASVSGYTAQISTFNSPCSTSKLPFDWQFTYVGAAPKFMYRTPDGIGDWSYETSAALPGTVDGTNDSGTVGKSEWYMDEKSWNSTANEVSDQSSNLNHGTAYNGLTTVTPGKLCNAGSFDGNNDYIEIPHDDSLQGSNTLTYSVWINPTAWSSGSSINQIMAKSVHGGTVTKSKTPRAQMGVFSENGRLVGRAETVGGIRHEVFTSLPAVSSWTHIALVYNGGILTFYINGVIAPSADGSHRSTKTFATTTLVQNKDPLMLSKRVGSNEYFFHGLIDEVLVFQPALQASFIQTMYSNYNNRLNWDGAARSCPDSLHHFEIDHDGTALTCNPEQVTIRACANATCTAPHYAAAVDITLSPSGWVGVNPQSITTGVLTPKLAITTASTVSLNITNSTVLPSSGLAATICKNTTSLATGVVGTAACNIVYSDSGFIFNNETDTTTIIPTQLSGKNSNVGYNAKTITLQAVKKSDSVPTQCSPAFQNKTLNIDFAAECRDPSTCIAGQQLILNSAALVTNNDNAAIGNSNYDTRSITFDANGKYNIVFNYPEAGSLELHARHNILSGDGVTPSGNFMSGSSIFIVRPLGFSLTGLSTSADASGIVFTQAGVDFITTLTTVAWEATDDADKNGIPDTGATLTDNYVTQNFGKEITPLIPANVTATHTTTMPNLGTLSNSSNSASFINGVGTKTLAWDEVGIINLTTTLSNYLSSGDNVVGTVQNVGRFNPHHFDNLITHGCTGGSTFSYSGQPFTVTTYARNKGNSTTKNYRDTYAYGVTLSDANPAATPTGSFTNNTISEPSFTSTAATDGSSTGVGTISTIFYTFANKDTIPDTLEIRATDIKDTTIISNGFTEGSTDIRSGRARLENVFGPELTSLTMPLKIEYYSDNATPADLADDGFVLNTDDSCTTYDATTGTLANYTGNLAAGETTVTGAGTIVAGIGNITFSAPGAGNDGSVNLLANNISSWLTYPWGVDCDGDTVNDTGACGTASFGLYRGDDRIIYWREVFQ